MPNPVDLNALLSKLVMAGIIQQKDPAGAGTPPPQITDEDVEEVWTKMYHKT